MSGARSLAVLNVGASTSLGTDAPSTCAALRAKTPNPSPSGFRTSTGEPLLVHAAASVGSLRGIGKLAALAARAIVEALRDVSIPQWHAVPLLLVVAEPDRPGRLDGLDDELLPAIERLLGVRFATARVVVDGRVGFATALALARVHLDGHAARPVLIVGCDSLVVWPTLRHYMDEGRLLSPSNSDGFIAGEGAGAVLVGRGSATPDFSIAGIGFGEERAHVRSCLPLRADGLVAAVRGALADAGRELHDIDYRIADVAGEQYYFKEASLAMSRILRRRKMDFELWHPAECLGETGAACGPLMLAAARAAVLKGYAIGDRALLHFSNDDGRRAAVATFGAR